MKIWSEREYEFITGKLADEDITPEYKRVIRHRVRKKIREVANELLKVAEIGFLMDEDLDTLMRVVEADLKAKGYVNLSKGIRITRLVIMKYLKEIKRDIDFIEVLDEIAQEYVNQS